MCQGPVASVGTVNEELKEGPWGSMERKRSRVQRLLSPGGTGNGKPFKYFKGCGDAVREAFGNTTRL